MSWLYRQDCSQHIEKTFYVTPITQLGTKEAERNTRKACDLLRVLTWSEKPSTWKWRTTPMSTSCRPKFQLITRDITSSCSDTHMRVTISTPSVRWCQVLLCWWDWMYCDKVGLSHGALWCRLVLAPPLGACGRPWVSKGGHWKKIVGCMFEYTVFDIKARYNHYNFIPCAQLHSTETLFGGIWEGDRPVTRVTPLELPLSVDVRRINCASSTEL